MNNFFIMGREGRSWGQQIGNRKSLKVNDTTGVSDPGAFKLEHLQRVKMRTST